MATTQGDAFPFVESGCLFVERALRWGEQYGIGVLIDFHAAPGSQNGAGWYSPDKSSIQHKLVPVSEEATRAPCH